MARTDWKVIHGTFSTHDGATAVVQYPGVDISLPELIRVTAGNMRTEGRKEVARTYGNRQVTYTLDLHGASSAGVLASLSSLMSACSENHDFYVQQPGASTGLTYKAFAFYPDVPSMDSDDWRATSSDPAVYNIGMDFEVGSYGLGSLSASASPGAVVALYDWPVTGVPGDVLANSIIGTIPNGAPVANTRWMVGRRATYSSAFNPIIDDDGTLVINAAVTGITGCYGSAYAWVQLASGSVATGICQTALTQVSDGAYRLMARVGGTSSAISFRARTYTTDPDNDATNGWVSLSKTATGIFEIVDLGAVAVPMQTMPDSVATYSTYVQVQARCATAATARIDFALLVPTDGGFAYIPDDTHSAYGYAIDGDSDTPGVYCSNDYLLSDVQDVVVAKPLSPIRLDASNNLVTFLWIANNATTSDSISLTQEPCIRYRPRYLWAR